MGLEIYHKTSSALEVKGSFWYDHPEMNAWKNPFQLLTIGELAQRTGVAPSALRYYEERGLIHSRRNEAGHRRYPRAVARRVAFIVFAQRVGLTLDEIKAELDKLPVDRIPTDEDWNRVAEMWRARIDGQIAQLQRLKEGLMDCIGCGCLSMERCAILNPMDRAARLGPGPRYWLGDELSGDAPVTEQSPRTCDET